MDNDNVIDRIPIELRGKKATFHISELTRLKIKAELVRIKSEVGVNDRMIADKLGMSRATYSQMMGAKTMNIANLEAIANALDCDVEIKFVPKDKKGYLGGNNNETQL